MSKGGIIQVENKSLMAEDFSKVCSVLKNITSFGIESDNRFTIPVDAPESLTFDPYCGMTTTKKNWFLNSIRYRLERNFPTQINNHITITYREY